MSELHKILFVDDDSLLLRSLRRVLAAAGYRVVTAESGQEALELLAREPVDLLLSDLDMPVMSGLELVSRVRRSFPEVVRILFTGSSSLESAIQAINRGEVFRYLTKPIAEAELLKVLAEGVARLSELRKASAASQLAHRRARLLAALCEEHPGISEIPRIDGAYPLALERLDVLVEQLQPQLRTLFLPGAEPASGPHL